MIYHDYFVSKAMMIVFSMELYNYKIKQYHAC